jgi:tRNA modification GTPase
MTTDTIYALSSGPGPAGIAVFRVSGPESGVALRALAGVAELPPPRVAIRVVLMDPQDGTALDDGIAIWFPGPNSYSGEDMVELHVHGGPAVIAAMLRSLGGRPGLRLAEPGEYTRRAFNAGKLDLTEAEGIADVIAAETEAQRRQAVRQADGALGRLYDGWREALVGAMAHYEALIDFPDEGLPKEVVEKVSHQISWLVDNISRHLDDSRRGERLRQGLDIAIVGPPNAGKSSLLNWLARRDAAIVSERAGTTRDVIDVAMDLGGYPVVLADTAGLREVADGIEEEGVRRARRRAEAADLRILVVDGQDEAGFGDAADLVDGSTILVLNKSDLGPARVVTDKPSLGTFAISVRTGAGIDGFLEGLEAVVRDRIGLAVQPALTRARHREALEECLDALRRSLGAPLPELTAEDLRLATRSLGRITGRVDVEDLLDVIFRDFCIGK